MRVENAHAGDGTYHFLDLLLEGPALAAVEQLGNGARRLAVELFAQLGTPGLCPLLLLLQRRDSLLQLDRLANGH